MPKASYSETARRVFALFLKSSFEELPVKIVEEIAESSPDPYYAVLYYALEGEKPSPEQMKSEIAVSA